MQGFLTKDVLIVDNFLWITLKRLHRLDILRISWYNLPVKGFVVYWGAWSRSSWRG
jgi:hypothetical protein